MDTVDRNYVAALIERAQAATRTAATVAEHYCRDDVAEKLADALDFQDAALEKLSATDRNPNGTTGPEHITTEGRELEPPQR